jgi:hypothetical protein
LFLSLLPFIIIRFGECQPPETTRIEADGSLAPEHIMEKSCKYLFDEQLL